MKIRFFSLFVFFLSINLSAFSGQSDFDKFAKTNGLVLPDVILYHDFNKRAYNMGIVDIDDFLEIAEMTIHGEGEGRYLLGRDLLNACGDDCSPTSGMGLLLVKFLEISHSGR